MKDAKWQMKNVPIHLACPERVELIEGLLKASCPC